MQYVFPIYSWRGRVLLAMSRALAMGECTHRVQGQVPWPIDGTPAPPQMQQQRPVKLFHSRCTMILLFATT